MKRSNIPLSPNPQKIAEEVARKNGQTDVTKKMPKDAKTPLPPVTKAR